MAPEPGLPQITEPCAGACFETTAKASDLRERSELTIAHQFKNSSALPREANNVDGFDCVAIKGNVFRACYLFGPPECFALRVVKQKIRSPKPYLLIRGRVLRGFRLAINMRGSALDHHN
jgi:hypothetical protein